MDKQRREVIRELYARGASAADLNELFGLPPRRNVRAGFKQRARQRAAQERDQLVRDRVVIFRGTFGMQLEDLAAGSLGVVLYRKGRQLRVRWDDGVDRWVYCAEVFPLRERLNIGR